MVTRPTAPGWAAEPPRFPQEGGGQRGAQPSGVGRGEGGPASCLLQTFLPSSLSGKPAQRRGVSQGPRCALPHATPGETIAERTISVLVAPCHHVAQCSLGLLAARPQTSLASPTCAQTHELHSFTHFFSRCLPDARTTCEVLCKVLGKQQESRPLS